MPTYIAMLKWTPQGLQNIKQSPSRLDAARKAFEVAGAKTECDSWSGQQSRTALPGWSPGRTPVLFRRISGRTCSAEAKNIACVYFQSG
jgi:hypothetical protein